MPADRLVCENEGKTHRIVIRNGWITHMFPDGGAGMLPHEDLVGCINAMRACKFDAAHEDSVRQELLAQAQRCADDPEINVEFAKAKLIESGYGTDVEGENERPDT